MRIVSQRVFHCYSSRTCWEWLFRQISAYFCLPPTQHVHLFTISVKNQARLPRKIIGSYSRVFTVCYKQGEASGDVTYIGRSEQ